MKDPTQLCDMCHTTVWHVSHSCVTCVTQLRGAMNKMDDYTQLCDMCQWVEL